MNIDRGKCRLILSILIIVLLSCRIDKPAQGYHTQHTSADSAGDAAGFPETFEVGNKPAYAAGDVVLQTGTWHLDQALIGTSDRDHGNGRASIRMKEGGKLTMKFDIPGRVRRIAITHAMYGADADGRWSLWYSRDEGAHWMPLGEEIVADKLVKTASFSKDIEGPVRLEVRAGSGGRLNIDDIDIREGYGKPALGTSSSSPTAATKDNNMATGNPSGATANTDNRNNFLLIHPQYALSYNNSKGMANWVSWHLSTAWQGNVKRCNCFFGDSELPRGFRSVLSSDYIGSGFSRGHLCPSEDRKDNNEDNAATFLMTNMSPQAILLNQQPWEQLETYCRQLTRKGNELYIIAGGYGSGGESNRGGIVRSIAGGSINVPSHFWKIIVVLPIGSDDIKRIGSATRVIAVDMPNLQSVNNYTWEHYCISVKALETATGYDFLSNVSQEVQEAIERKVDKGPNR